MPRKKLVIEPKPMTIRKPIRRSKIVLPDIIDMEYVVTNALQDEASKSSNNLTMTDAKKIAPAVTTKVEEQVRAEMQPVIDHLTNNEPWYQSRVTWGALIAAAAGIDNQSDRGRERLHCLQLAPSSAFYFWGSSIDSTGSAGWCWYFPP
jgi:hypothetical protein